MKVRMAAACGGMLLLAGCGAAVPTPAPVSASSPTPRVEGLERVMGQTAKSLTAMFGRPDQDVREANGRKLQFGNAKICVLDAYLYAKKSGQEPVVTWIDARRPDGADTDRAKCAEALKKD
jgi:hypothetical protein